MNALDGIPGNQNHGFNSQAMQKAQAESDAKAQAKLDLAAAEADAKALLAELEAADAVAPKSYKMPPRYAPGEEPDPVAGVAQPEGYQAQLYNALDGNFKPATPETITQSTLASSHTVDFAQKIRDANKYRK